MATLHVGNPTIINMEEPQSSSKDPSITDDFMYNSNVASAHIYIRMGFLRKVYGILCTQLLITAAYAYMCFKFEPLEQFYKNNPWMLFVVMILSFVFLIGLHVKAQQTPINFILLGLFVSILSFVFLIGLHVKAQQTPINFILLGLFTLCEASLIGCVVTMYDGFIVIEAALITFAVTLGLTLYTFQSKRDFSKMGSTLIVLLMMLIMVSFLQIFLRAEWMDLGIAVVGAVIFSAFIIYDTHLLMHRLSPEEYMTASVNLYLDIINLFLYILRILNAAKK